MRRSVKYGLYGAAVAAVVGGTAAFATAASGTPITLVVDGQTKKIDTSAQSVQGALKSAGYHPRDYYAQDDELRAALDAISAGAFGGVGQEVAASLLDRDEYLTLADYRAYIDCQAEVDAAWQDQDRWTRASILNTARTGFFSADRTVRDYVSTIWHVEPVRGLRLRRGRHGPRRGAGG